jgi:hypothetical protein
MSKRNHGNTWFGIGAVVVVLINLAWLSFVVWAIYELVQWVTSK